MELAFDRRISHPAVENNPKIATICILHAYLGDATFVRRPVTPQSHLITGKKVTRADK
jgi:hypothetical protein